MPAAAGSRPTASVREFADLRGVVVRVRVESGASPERVSLYRDGSLRAWVGPAAQEGRDNLRLKALLGRLAGVPARRIEILTGVRTPWKLVRIPGISRRELRSRIPRQRGGYRFGDGTGAARREPV